MSFSSVLDIIEGKVRQEVLQYYTQYYTHFFSLPVPLSPSVLQVQKGAAAAPAVFYVQKQCSNLLQELPELTDDVEPHISWMSTALGDFLSF